MPSAMKLLRQRFSWVATRTAESLARVVRVYLPAAPTAFGQPAEKGDGISLRFLAPAKLETEK
jgi:hypothetical protein